MIRSLLLLFCFALAPLPSHAQSLPVAPDQTPRLDVDYEVLPTPQPTYAPGKKIEVAEVFSYRCSHCADFQPTVDAWLKTKPADVRWEYVPAAFGGSWDTCARAFFAAESLGVLKTTHDAVFNGIFREHLISSGTLEELADLYARFGVDRARFLATMQSDAMTPKLARAREFVMRTGVQGTPSIIVNGKYRVKATRERGFDGMLATVNFLVAKERAGARASKK